MTKLTFIFILIMILSSIQPVQSLSVLEASELFEKAKMHVLKGEYKQAINIYDQILDTFPDNISTLKMKGIVLINSGEYVHALKQFYKILQQDPNNIEGLVGMGAGLGYLGEYKEAENYFNKAYLLDPENVVIKNYKEFIEKVMSKYPYTPTEKPLQKHIQIPQWTIKMIKWWTDDKIDDESFINSVNFLVSKKIIQFPISQSLENLNQISESKTKFKIWLLNSTSDEIIIPEFQKLLKSETIFVLRDDIKKQKQNEFRNFELYLREILKNIELERRYIEYPNPSEDVIKKFLRDYVKWNFEQEAKMASESFPNPTYEIHNGTTIIHYKIYVNEQPTGLPLDHVSTLEESIKFWQSQDLWIDNQKASVQFTYTNKKNDANIWITWVVRSLGEGVLGHAHLGKGIVEVVLGDYECDGNFQLYDVETVKKIMTHELGHSIGLKHSNNSQSVMYSSIKPHYAYCLLE